MINCANCGKKTTNNKCCSQECSRTYQNLISSAKVVVRRCINCGKVTRNPKFCSHHCSAIFVNSRRIPKDYYCQKCGKFICSGHQTTKHKTFCKQCNPNNKDWSKITLYDFKNGRTLSNYHSRLRSLARKMYNKTDQPKCCSKCGWKHHYEVCHIKPIKDFNENDTISTINNIDNLVALCPNCHWMFDHNLLVLDGSNDLPARSL